MSEKRVRVWNSDKSHCFGDGNRKEDVTVYYIELPGGGSVYTTNPETYPSDKVMARYNGTVETEISSKFEMDDGAVRYGCITYWEEIDEEEK